MGSAIHDLRAALEFILHKIGQHAATGGVVTATRITEVERRDAVGQRTVSGVHVQRQHDVDSHVVCEGCALFVCRYRI